MMSGVDPKGSVTICTRKMASKGKTLGIELQEESTNQILKVAHIIAYRVHPSDQTSVRSSISHELGVSKSSGAR